MNLHAVNLLSIPAAAALIGVALFLWSWRGKRINDHPTCRRCGYDLTGRPPDSHKCSECGSDLDQKQAIRTGQRQRRIAGIVTALTLVTCSFAWLGISGWHIARSLTAQQKPVWWLMMDTRSKTPSTADAALDELVTRWDRGRLSPAQANKVADAVLTVQGNPLRSWDWAWGETIEHIRAQGRLDDSKWDRYGRQAWSFNLVVRPKVRRGQPLAIRLDVASPSGRAGQIWSALTRPWLRVWRCRIVDLRIRGTECPVPEAGTTWGDNDFLFALGFRPENGLVDLPPSLRDMLRDGTHEIEATAELNLSKSESAPKYEQLGRFRIKLRAQFDLVPPDVATVNLKTPPELRTSAQTAFRVGTLFSHDQRVELIVEPQKFPVIVAADVFLRSNGREWPVGSYLYDPAEPNHGWNALPVNGGSVPGFSALRADVILRPSIKRAEQTVDITEIWGGEIILKDIPVMLQGLIRT